jgi:hypothetical protein
MSGPAFREVNWNDRGRLVVLVLVVKEIHEATADRAEPSQGCGESSLVELGGCDLLESWRSRVDRAAADSHPIDRYPGMVNWLTEITPTLRLPVGRVDSEGRP